MKNLVIYNHPVSLCLLGLCILFSPVNSSFAKSEKPLQVGVKVTPPFVVRNDDGSLSGLSIDLWHHIATELQLNYQLQEMPLPALLNGLQSAKLDVAVAAMTVTAEREKMMDFSHPFHSSGLGIAVSENRSGALKNVLQAVFSLQFIQALAALAIVLTIIAILIWLSERKQNPRHFGGSGSLVKGLGAGFWWSAVTMTTVGYGDKAPITFWGRTLAIIWMFASVITISGFTATIASVFTLQQIQGQIQGPQDLPGNLIATVTGSTGERYAQQKNLQYISVDSAHAALQALAEGRVKAVVYDLPILRYLIRHHYDGRVSVLVGTFERQDYALGLRTNSPLREPINRELLNYINHQQWQQNLSRYLGD